LSPHYPLPFLLSADNKRHPGLMRRLCSPPPALASHPSLQVSTKVGYFTAATGVEAVSAGALTIDQAPAGHSHAPNYWRWQTGRNREQLGRDRLDLVLLRNPERAHPGDRPAARRHARGYERLGL
ncbi:hypothetical protein ABZ177_33345, partial [Streptomyces sp. NPDC006284]